MINFKQTNSVLKYFAFLLFTFSAKIKTFPHHLDNFKMNL